jgi:hypothetical protein
MAASSETAHLGMTDYFVFNRATRQLCFQIDDFLLMFQQLSNQLVTLSDALSTDAIVYTIHSKINSLLSLLSDLQQEVHENKQNMLQNYYITNQKNYVHICGLQQAVDAIEGCWNVLLDELHLDDFSSKDAEDAQDAMPDALSDALSGLDLDQLSAIHETCEAARIAILHISFMLITVKPYDQELRDAITDDAPKFQGNVDFTKALI